jgi:hypothetical protein
VQLEIAGSDADAFAVAPVAEPRLLLRNATVE